MKRLFALPKAFFLWLIHHPQITTTIGVLCLLLLVWFGGDLIGLSSEDGDLRLVIVIGILFLWVFLLLLASGREGRGGRSLERSLQQQAEAQFVAARPDRKEEIKALQEELEKAISALKHSKLGKGKRGTAALYALPWYMFIGPSASGKSTALLHSGLHFPYLGSSGRGIQGVGGTRNCDWWFTSEAVLLDTAGRYVSEDEDREEWFGFLDLLKKNRKKKPINGVIAAISIADIFQSDEEEVERNAINMRERIDELTERLGVSFPVYLVFTKCDLIQGFIEFFEDLSKKEREQIWGCTFSKKALSASPSHHLFDAEFQQLCDMLGSRRLARLTSARGSRKVREVYTFPLQFVSGKEKLSRFVEILFKENPYRDNPLFRGFYFTSGTQEGTPIDQILRGVSRSSGLSDVVNEGLDFQAEPKSYFIKDLFTEVVFPDQFLAGASNAMSRRRGSLRVASLIAATLLTVFSLTGFAFSFLGNKNLIRSVRSVSLEAAQIDALERDKVDKNLPLLNALKLRLSQLQSYEKEGVPLHLRLGLYQGDVLIPPLRKLYFDRFAAILLSPVVRGLEAELDSFVSTQVASDSSRSAYHYDLLKVYLMLADPEKTDPDFLKRWFHTALQKGRYLKVGGSNLPETLNGLALEQVDFYVQETKTGGALPIRLNASLVQSVRQRLLNVSVAERLYADIIRQGGKDLRPYSLKTALEGLPQNLFFSDFKVPGFFTKAGWDHFPDVMTSVLSGSSEVSWVLGMGNKNQNNLRTEIEKRYQHDYARYWERYLESIAIRPGENLFDIKDKIGVLTAVDSPLKKLLVGVDRHTYLFGEGESPLLASSSEGFVDRVKSGLGLGSDGSETPAPSQSGPANLVSKKFQSLHRFVLGGADPEAPPLIDQFSGELAKVDLILKDLIDSAESGQSTGDAAKGIMLRGENELVQAARNTKKLLQTLDPTMRAAMERLFLEPYKMSAQGILNDAAHVFNRLWQADVFQSCRRNIDGRYPFKVGGDDVALSDFSELFQPESGLLWQFYEAQIKTFVVEDRSGFRAKKGMMGVSLPMTREFLQGLTRARLLSKSLFQKGNQNPSFSFGLYPHTMRGVSESLFQMDGDKLRYRNELQEWYEFTWPGKTGPPGASLQIRTGEIGQARQFDGKWGLFKLLDKGLLEELKPNRYKVSWRFRQPDGSFVEVNYDLRASSHKNPLKRGLFSEFHCVKDVTSNG